MEAMNLKVRDEILCTVSLCLTLIGELANAVSAVRWITSCISDPGPWANIHLHLLGVKFPSSPSLDSTSPVHSHHLRSYCSALLTVPLIRRGFLCLSAVHPYSHWPRSTCSQMWLHLSIHQHHPLKHLSTFIQTVKNNDPKNKFTQTPLLTLLVIAMGCYNQTEKSTNLRLTCSWLSHGSLEYLVLIG